MAIFVQIVEFPHPVAADGEDIHLIFLDVVYLLAHIVLDDDFVGQAGRLHGLHALQHVVHHVELSPLAVEIVVGHAHDEIVAQRLCAPQQVDMPLVEHVIGAVCDYFFHAKWLGVRC